MIISNNDPLFQHLRPARQGENFKNFPQGAYRLTIQRKRHVLDGSVRQKLCSSFKIGQIFSSIRAGQTMTDESLIKMTDLLVDPTTQAMSTLEAACCAALQSHLNSENCPSPVVNLPEGDVVFTPSVYRRSLKRAKHAFEEMTKDPQFQAKLQEEKQRKKELGEKLAKPHSARFDNLISTVELINLSGKERGRSPESILKGILYAVSKARKAETRHDWSQLINAKLGPPPTLEEQFWAEAFRQEAANVLKDPNSGKIYIEIQPTSKKQRMNSLIKAHAVIRKIVPPKKKKP